MFRSGGSNLGAGFSATFSDITVTSGGITGASGITFGIGSSSAIWNVSTGGVLLPAGDVTRDIGDATHRIRDIVSSRGIIGGTTKTLTESAATGIADIAVASGSRVSGVLYYSIEADDATDFQVRTGMAYFTSVNKAGTVTTGIQVVGTEGVITSAGTLAVTVTNLAGTLKSTLQLNAVSSLTQTTLQAKWKIVSADAVGITAL